MDGGGFDAPNMSIRVSLANLPNDAYANISRSGDHDYMADLIGYKSPSKSSTEYVTFGIGILLGYLIG